jgi:acyl-CoA reductase-like NAD-dependent aldehyde dehydrogenase
MDHVVSHPLVPFVSFTGSVANGKHVEKTAAAFAGPGFKSVGLELGGKDAAYVRAGQSSSIVRMGLTTDGVGRF